MFLNDICTEKLDSRYQKLIKILDEDFGIDVSIYEYISENDLRYFMKDLEEKKAKIIAESTFNSQYQDEEYARTSLLLEAVRIILKEIRPKRLAKKIRNTDTSKMEKNEQMTEEEVNLSPLLEGELERAELVMATKDVVGRLQKMIEDLSKMGTDDIMPLVDALRSHYGGPVAEKFSKTAEHGIQIAAHGVQEMKDNMDKQAHNLEQRISDEDARKPFNDLSGMQAYGSSNEIDATNIDANMGTGMNADIEPEVSNDDLNALEEPLGRAKKETYVVKIAGKSVKLNEEQYKALKSSLSIIKKIQVLTEEENSINSTIILINGKSIKLNEWQVKSLLFAKNFNRIVEENEASTVKLSDRQAYMIKTAKGLTSKILELTKV